MQSFRDEECRILRVSTLEKSTEEIGYKIETNKGIIEIALSTDSDTYCCEEIQQYTTCEDLKKLKGERLLEWSFEVDKPELLPQELPQKLNHKTGWTDKSFYHALVILTFEGESKAEKKETFVVGNYHNGYYSHQGRVSYTQHLKKLYL
jgi:hypothetical protein